MGRLMRGPGRVLMIVGVANEYKVTNVWKGCVLWWWVWLTGGCGYCRTCLVFLLVPSWINLA